MNCAQVLTVVSVHSVHCDKCKRMLNIRSSTDVLSVLSRKSVVDTWALEIFLARNLIAINRETFCIFFLFHPSQKHITRSFNPDMGKKFTHLLTRGRPVTSLPCTTIVDQLGPPLKGSLEERLYLTLTLAGGGQAGVLSDQIMKVKMDVRTFICLCG